MEIEFKQFLMPNGRVKLVNIDRPQEVCEKAKQIKEAGYSLEIETLITGEISMTIADSENETDLAIEVCPNGPAVPEHVDKMILGFDLTKVEQE